MADFNLEQYLPVLQSIEVPILVTYQQLPDLTDHQVDKVLEALERGYKAEQRDRKPPRLRLSEVEEALCHRIRQRLEWYMGRADLSDDETGTMASMPAPLAVEETIACVKRIRRSIKLWTKDYGRQGYLNYITRTMSGEA